ncbi:MAG: ATP-dependent helicase [Candidatus Diapherotrites archaeon]|nr:ATP-dependent helicase [Candidatus Diapherotrites archaeon]
MITKLTHEYPDEEVYSILAKPVRKWFKETFGGFTPPQKYAVMEIHKGKNILISSPTGSGKTLSAFLASINELVLLAQKNALEDRTYVLYVSPLKALNNDIKRNLDAPLRGIEKIANLKQKIRVAVRTGDTTQSQRSSMLRKPPHILITTPESLAILLNSPRAVKMLENIKYVIVDEIHSLCENKRGTHLMLSLERLQNRVKKEFIRIGLSATIHPLEEVAQFLVGTHRDCAIVDVNFLKKIELSVVSPVDDFIYSSVEETQINLYKLLDDLISKHKTTLIFTNTRSGTERVVHHLKKMFGNKYVGVIGTHHSSLGKDIRLNVEEQLKKGELKVVVSSTSLELGIDIGNIDLVILLGSPKSITRALQRVGRSGHRLHETSKGVFVVTDRDDLIECVVLAKAARDGKLDRVHIPKNCLDVLAQHIVGMSLEKDWDVGEMFGVITKAYPYKDLNYDDYLNLLKYLNGEYGELQNRKVYGKIYFDGLRISKRGRMIRPIYYMNIGTIPDETAIKVFTKKGQFVGTLDETFMQRMKRGDIFVLGGTPYRYLYVRGMKLTVESAIGKRPTVPSWYSESLPLSFDLAMEINKFRKRMDEVLSKESKNKIIEALQKEFMINKTTANAIFSYFMQQKKYLRIPTHTHIIIEEFIDVDGRKNLIFHTLFGRKVNDALSRIFAYLISEEENINIGITISDNGFVLTLPRRKKVDYSTLYRRLCEADIISILKDSLEGTEILRRRFRHVAARSFLILRRYIDGRRSVGKQQMSAYFLYNIIKKIDPNFPIIKETYREILEDAMDLENTIKVVKWIKNRKTFIVLRNDRELPSPFAHNLIAGASDTMRIQDKKKLLQYLHEYVLRKIGEKT